MFYKSAINVKNIGNDGVGTDFVQLEQLKATCGILFDRNLPQVAVNIWANCGKLTSLVAVSHFRNTYRKLIVRG